MKIGVVGSGMVGGSAAFAAVMTGAASEIVLVDVNEKLAQAQAEDILHAVPYAHPARVSAGHYEQLKGAGVVLICCGGLFVLFARRFPHILARFVNATDIGSGYASGGKSKNLC